MNFLIDFAKKEDILGIEEVYGGWKEFEGILPREFTKGDTKEGLLKYFDGTDNSRKYIVAKVGGKIVGVCYIEVLFLDLKNIRLGDMIVDKNFRKRGIASALIDKAVDFAKENKVCKIWLWTQEELKEAIDFYEGKGFIFEGRQKKQFCGKDALIYGYILTY